MINWILISILVLVILLGIVAIVNIKKRKISKPDYAAFFSMGMVWIAFGIIFYDSMFFFFPLGIVFLVLGLSHKKEWKKNYRSWKQLSKPEKALKIIGITILATGIIILGVYYFWLKKGI